MQWITVTGRMNGIPTCYSEAVNAPEAENWKKAMNEEVESLLDNEPLC